jgi:RHS repeat-associated protein
VILIGVPLVKGLVMGVRRVTVLRFAIVAAVSVAAIVPALPSAASTIPASVPAVAATAVAQLGSVPVATDPATPNSAPPSVAGQPVAADGELTGLRTATSLTYLASKAPKIAGATRARKTGYVTRVSDVPINFRDSHGVWQKIDQTLVAAASGFSPTATQDALVVPGDASSTPVTLTDAADGMLSWQLQGAASATGTTAGAARSWPAALPGVTHTVTATGSGFDDSVTLASASATASFTYVLRVPAGDTASLANGAVTISNAAGAPLGSVAAASMADAAGAHSTAVRYALTAGTAPGSYVLTVTPDASWLAASGRVFPVSIDPYVTFDIWSTGELWTRLDGQNATTNEFGTYPAVGYDGGQTNRMLATFNTTSIPTDAVVNFGDFQVQTSSTDNGDDQQVELHGLTRAWTSGATWNSYDGTHAWTSAGGDFGSAALWTQTLTTGSGDIENFPMTTLVRSWINGSAANDGLLIKATTEGYVGGDAHMNYFNDAYMDVDWAPRVGTPAAAANFTRNLDDHLALNLNVADGNLNLLGTDFNVPSPGLNMVVTRAWNSMADGGTSVGEWNLAPGPDMWWQNYGDSYVFQAPDGSQEPFGANEAGTVFTRPVGVLADAVINSDQSGTITDRKTGRVTNLTQSNYSAECTTSIADRAGNAETIGYGAAGGPGPCLDMTSITDTAGRVYTVANDGSEYTKITDPTSRAVTYTVTSGELTNVKDTSGNNTVYGYDGSGRVTKVTTPAGRVVKIGYDASNRATSIQFLTNVPAGTGPTYTFAYTPATTPGGSGTTVSTDPLSHTTTFTYDVNDHVTKTVDALGHSRSATYTPNGDVQTAVDAIGLGNTTTLGYDANDNPNSVTLPTGAAATAAYANGTGCSTTDTTHPYLPKCVNDAQGHQSTLTYDGPGNVLTASDATLGTQLTLTRNPATPTCGGKAGQVCTSKDGNSHITTLHYDSSGNLTTITPPTPLSAISQTFDGLGRVATSTDGKGQKTTYSYDGMDRVTQVLTNGATICTYSAGTCVTHVFDADGNMTSQHDKTGTTTVSFDGLGRELVKTFPSTATATLSYDAAGNVSTYADAGGTVTYGYNNANQLTSLAEPGGSCTGTISLCTTFGVNNNGARTTTTYPGNTVMTTTVDNSGRPTEIKAVNGTTTISDFTYSYAPGGVGDSGLAQKRVDAKNSLTTTYTYDSKNELTSAVEKNSGGTTIASWLYCYDNAGNRTSFSSTSGASCPGATTTYTYNAANELTALNGSSTGWSYDADGNETAGNSTIARSAETYTASNQLSSITTGGSAAAMTYAGLLNDERVTSGSTTTFQTGQEGLANQTVSSATTSWTRDPSGTLISERSGTNHYYYDFDGLGSVVALIGSTGTVLDTYSYDPYGKTRASTGTTANPFQYTSSYLDATGLYHNGARYYDPNLGRFTQQDPTGQEANFFAYAGDDPVNLVDPTGRSWVSSFLTVAAGVTAAIGGVATVLGVTDFAAALAGGTLLDVAIGGLAIASGGLFIVTAAGLVYLAIKYQ